MTMQKTLTEFAEMLDELEIPVANGEFLELTECPYLSFFLTANNSIMADGVPVCLNASVEVHLITKGIRDYALENRLEELLTGNGYPFTSSYSQNIEQMVHECAYLTTIVQ